MPLLQMSSTCFGPNIYIDEPWRSRASAQLKLIFRFRKLLIPPAHATLRLLQLSHDILHHTRQHLRHFLQLHAHLFPPLQAPASPIVEIKSHPWDTTSSTSANSFDVGNRSYL